MDNKNLGSIQNPSKTESTVLEKPLSLNELYRVQKILHKVLSKEELTEFLKETNTNNLIYSLDNDWYWFGENTSYGASELISNASGGPLAKETLDELKKYLTPARPVCWVPTSGTHRSADLPQGGTLISNSQENKMYNPLTCTLFTGTDLISPKLQWLIEQTVLKFSDMNAVHSIHIRREHPKKGNEAMFGHFFPDPMAIVVNLQHHWNVAAGMIQDSQKEHMSIKAIVLKELLDTVAHEAAHAQICFLGEEADEKQIKESVKGAELIISNLFDVDLQDYGSFFEKLSAQKIQELTLLEKKSVPDNEQLRMLKDGIAFYDSEHGHEFITFREVMEQLSETPFIKMESSEFNVFTIIEPAQAMPTEQTDQEWPGHQPMFNGVEGYEDQSVLPPNPPPTTLNVSQDTLPNIFRRLFFHMFSKCDHHADGTFGNPGAVLEAVNIADIPGNECICENDTLDEHGAEVSMHIPGQLKGKVDVNSNRPYYSFSFMWEGRSYKRIVLPADPYAQKDGKPTQWAQKAMTGHRIAIFRENGLNGIPKADLKLAPGEPAGQEVLSLWQKK